MFHNSLVPTLFLLALLVVVSPSTAQDCRSPVKYCDYHADYFPVKPSFRYSSTIRNVVYRRTHVDFTIHSNVTASPFVTFPQIDFHYRLVQCGCNAITAPAGRTIVYTNPAGVYVSEGPTLGLLQALIPKLYPLKFSGSADFIFSPRARARIARNLTTPLSSFDLAPLKEARKFGVSLIGTYGVGGYVAADTGKPFITIGEVSERTLLGRAEYINLLGLLFRKSGSAAYKFRYVARHYNYLRRKVNAVLKRKGEKPEVFFNYPFPPTWTQPGEFQYTTSAALQAGGDYAFKNDGRLLGQSLTLPEIVETFEKADVLLNSALFPYSSNATLMEYIDSGNDEFKDTVKKLNAVKAGNVWSIARRISPNRMASDYFESAAFRADLLLRDYIKILHPELGIKRPFVYVNKYK